MAHSSAPVEPLGPNTPVYGIEGMNVFCRSMENLHETVRFYTEALGLPFFLPYEEGQDYAAISLGAATIWLKVSPEEYLPLAPEQGGHIAMAVENLEEACAVLEGRVTWTSPIGRWDLPEDTYYRYRRLCDPAGNLLFIIECHDAKSPNGRGGAGYRPADVGRGPHPEE